MTYAQSFDTSQPTGLEAANTIDEIIRNVKIALDERFIDILGVDLSAATDPQRVTKIVIPAAGMNIRNSSDAASLISFTNSGASLASPTITGTMTATGATISGGTIVPTSLTIPSGAAITNAALTTPALVDAVLGGSTVNTGTISGGTVSSVTISGGTISGATLSGTTTNSGTISGGTVSPSALTVPSGTTIPTHTETGTITATGSTRNGGTLSGATLNNTTFTGTTSGLTTNPTVISATLGSAVSLGNGFTSVLSTSSLTTLGAYLFMASGTVTVATNGQALDRVQLSLNGANSGSVTQTFGVVGSSSTNPTSYSIPFSFMFTGTVTAGNPVTLGGYKLGSSNTATVEVANIIAMRIN